MTNADLIVLRGQPDDDELAALVAVLAAIDARAAAESTSDNAAAGLWATGPSRPAFRPPHAWGAITPR
ncbi:acyl-CoA carboxylase epsilon subunit [Actinocrispum wychmicini]|uniref:Acyl-CoA carboxylase epsilon subunit-like protein n=1 Tax=Actinocrispum wychmicini TaxID=1213861 RepID=A0A4R2J5V6_9PSEU|nr:acyl-CoA carboxylase epsilon subunit [Actinocrispum wychmicini]TCO52822.1 acyl-CoA carboxylase epsilon subunit-like protein [Actinocrispum wychmicini]